MHKLKFILVVLLLSASALAAGSNNVRQVAILDLPGRPGFDEMVFAKGMLVISHTSSNTVEIFDPFRRRVVGTVKDMSSPRGVALSSDGTSIYIANHDANNIVEIKTDDWQVKRIIPVQGQPDAILPVPNSHLLLVSLPESQEIAAVDLGHGQQISSVNVGGRPEDLAFDTNRNIAYVSIQDRKEIVTVNPSMQVAKHMPLNGSLPTGIVYDRASDRLYVAVRYAVLTLDPQTGTEVGRVPAAGGVDHLWLDEKSQMLYAMSNGSVFIMKAGGKLSEPEEIAVDVKGHTLAFDPSKNFIYVPGGREGRAKLLILKQLTPGGGPQTQNAGGAPVVPVAAPTPTEAKK
jgi:DNA-binding beta-propeller fold protein YncE